MPVGRQRFCVGTHTIASEFWFVFVGGSDICLRNSVSSSTETLRVSSEAQYFVDEDLYAKEEELQEAKWVS